MASQPLARGSCPLLGHARPATPSGSRSGVRRHGDRRLGLDGNERPAVASASKAGLRPGRARLQPAAPPRPDREAPPGGCHADKDKPKPDFSNVRSGSSSTAPRPTSPETQRTYTVVKGDSLSKIAERFYGDANRWRQIHDANRDAIRDPDLIHPGQVLKIPNS